MDVYGTSVLGTGDVYNPVTTGYIYDRFRVSRTRHIIETEVAFAHRDLDLCAISYCFCQSWKVVTVTVSYSLRF